MSAILRNANAIHIAFKLNAIKYSLDNFPSFYNYRRDKTKNTDYYWNDSVYNDLGI